MMPYKQIIGTIILLIAYTYIIIYFQAFITNEYLSTWSKILILYFKLIYIYVTSGWMSLDQ